MSADPTGLDRLHDIVPAPPVSWWPPAPGWQWLAGIMLILLIGWSAVALARWQRNRYRREALAEWNRQVSRLEDVHAACRVLGELAILLKRAALTAYPRAQVASLTGPAWLAFLDRAAAMRDFSSETGDLLERAVYDSGVQPSPQQARAAAELVRRWLRQHRSPLC